MSDYPSKTTITPRQKTGSINVRELNKKLEDDFGYILLIIEQNREIEKCKATNCITIRFTNNGKFDFYFDFLSSMNFDGLGFNYLSKVNQLMLILMLILIPKQRIKNHPRKILIHKNKKLHFLLFKNQIEIKMG